MLQSGSEPEAARHEAACAHFGSPLGLSAVGVFNHSVTYDSVEAAAKPAVALRPGSLIGR